MCVSINDEAGAIRYLNEYMRNGFGLDYVRQAFRVWGDQEGWFKDHEITQTGQIWQITKRKPKTEPGVKAVEKAIEEVIKTTPSKEPPRKTKARAKV